MPAARPPKDTIGQVQFETIPWEDRADDPIWTAIVVIEELTTRDRMSAMPGVEIEILSQWGPASGKPVHLRLKADDWDDAASATAARREKFEATPGLTLIEDTLPLPGIDWQIDVDVEKAGRYGADVATVGAMVQLVTRGILLDTMRVDSSDEEIEIRVRLPEQGPVLSTLDTLRVRTRTGSCRCRTSSPGTRCQAGRDQPRRPDPPFRREGRCGAARTCPKVVVGDGRPGGLSATLACARTERAIIEGCGSLRSLRRERRPPRTRRRLGRRRWSTPMSGSPS